MTVQGALGQAAQQYKLARFRHIEPFLDSIQFELRYDTKYDSSKFETGNPKGGVFVRNSTAQRSMLNMSVTSSDTIIMLNMNNLRNMFRGNDDSPEQALFKIDSLFKINLGQRGITENYQLDTFVDKGQQPNVEQVRHIIKDSTQSVVYGTEDRLFVLINNEATPQENKQYIEASANLNLKCHSFVRARFGRYNGYIISRMAGMLAASLMLSLLTAGAFFYLLYIIRQQRKLAELKNDFINAMTHELQTPIATASAAVEAMQHFNVLENPTRTQEYLGIAQHQLLQLSGMVDETLRLAVEERDHFKIITKNVDLQEIMQPILQHFQVQYGDKANIGFENLMQDGVNVDREHFSWAVKNLVDNALKYGPPSGKKVNIKAWASNEHWHLSVADNGRGIAPEHQKHLFERFYRAPSDTNVKGFGLGLYIVRRIVEGHGGSIGVESEAGKGSVFMATMPWRQKTVPNEK